MSFKNREECRKTVVSAMINSNKQTGRPKEDRELVVRKTITVLPSLWLEFQALAKFERISVSELMSILIAGYIKDKK